MFSLVLTKCQVVESCTKKIVKGFPLCHVMFCDRNSVWGENHALVSTYAVVKWFDLELYYEIAGCVRLGFYQ